MRRSLPVLFVLALSLELASTAAPSLAFADVPAETLFRRTRGAHERHLALEIAAFAGTFVGQSAQGALGPRPFAGGALGLAYFVHHRLAVGVTSRAATGFLGEDARWFVHGGSFVQCWFHRDAFFELSALVGAIGNDRAMVPELAAAARVGYSLLGSGPMRTHFFASVTAHGVREVELAVGLGLPIF